MLTKTKAKGAKHIIDKGSFTLMVRSSPTREQFFLAVVGIPRKHLQMRLLLLANIVEITSL